MTSPDGKSLSAYQDTQGSPVGSWQMDINLGELGVQLLFGPLRKLLSTVTGLPESTWPNTTSLIAGLQDQFGEVPILGDLIEVITGREDGNLDDLGTWINQLKTLLTGGIVNNPLPTLVGIALGTVQRMVQQIADILNGLVVTPINNAIQGVKDWFANLLGWQSTTTSNVSAASSAASSASSAASAAQTNANNLATNINNAISGGVAAGAGAIAGVFDTIGNIFGVASAANAAAINAQSQLAQQDNSAGTPVAGMSWSTTFSGSDGSALSSSDWSGSNLCIRGSSGYLGVLDSLGADTYQVVTSSAHQFNSDTQSASFVIGSMDGSAASAYTGVVIRANAAGSAGAFCRVNKSTVQIGKVVSGSSTVFTQVSRTQSAGDIVRFRCDGNNYYVSVNGTTVISYTDTTAAVATGPGYRFAVLVQNRVNILFGVADSARIASFAMSDWAGSSSGVTTPSWRLRKGSAGYTPLAVAAGASAALPTSLLTSQDLAVGCTVTTLGIGKVTIATAGWYEIQYTGSVTVTQSDGAPYRQPSGDQQSAAQWGLMVNSTLILGPLPSGAATSVYLNVGDAIQPYILATQVFPTGVGTSSNNGPAGNTNYHSSVTGVGGPTTAFTGRLIAA